MQIGDKPWMGTRGFFPSTSKTMYNEFSKRHNNSNLEVNVGERTISQVEHFKYLQSIIQNE